MTQQAKKLRGLNDKCLKCGNELTAALELLSIEASSVCGEDVYADFCNGGEIEFRYQGDEMHIAYRLEDLVRIANKGKEKEVTL